MNERIDQLRQRFDTEPLVIFMDIKLEKIGKGYAVLTALIRPEFLIAGKRIVQGGVIDVIADFAGVYAAMSTIPVSEEEFHTPAQTLTTHFLRPISGDEHLIRAVALVSDETRGHVIVNVDTYTAAEFAPHVNSNKKASTRICFSKPRKR
ncbi:MAG: hypothetical protein A3B99_03870 [Candidatus Yanofskybacteria bacterium RIFCSPHIGHO2_02_FULL_44_12b]|uniref:Thioesterase domain-containing protein n=2 Tax=Candidatus Yanofskyibacteriota TaxID=1752733 RepID=A0A1F8GMW4_9BACT|nr:MAG: hypothetical protein UW79_C0035G0010 [Candidatus Yanofskybacteria bacterium GW2011_GWA2_44_9]OGN04678.1 MAG: hypothetical protein A2659_00970 [Candidatus Yanofskybacteria bacterium RIFCSPHIGHO2_01_FULL_44_24]OGN15657.1 MAG: hypothetical protein A3B99_03870 [Candidatus Yanofskybacteria bacterium RIFCSPHIGHO2_02_FULL_44_12b]OGN26713.1 MAG: hypothetical protein A2925_03955 [Candidatus Yanofskybacteria bacterium RIFCSPLOWO2_01_FULL_44_22]